MKVLKKIVTGVLSLAIVGVLFICSGCNTVKNKTYAYDSRSYTIIISVDPSDSTKITETRTLSAKEYWLAFVSSRKVDLAEVAAATMSAAEENLYSDWLAGVTGAAKNTEYKFGKKNVEITSVEVDSVSGNKELEVYTSDYEIVDDVIMVKSLVESNEYGNFNAYIMESWYVVDEKIEVRSYQITSTLDYAVNKVLYISDYYKAV